MRIDQLELLNYKKFEHRTFEFAKRPTAGDSGSFHVLIGENGSGKTTVLDAAAVALSVWLTKPPDSLLANSYRRLSPDQKRLIVRSDGDRTQTQEAPGELRVGATGTLLDHAAMAWSQTLPVGKKKVTNRDAEAALAQIESAVNRVQKGERVVLPVLAYYGAGRAWLPHNQRKTLKGVATGPANRWQAFYDCLSERIRLSDLISWFRAEAIERGNRAGRYRPGFEAVLWAVRQTLPGAEEIRFDADREEILIAISGSTQPLSNLSAGQRSLFALVADVAIKMVTLNNFFVPADALGPEDQPTPRVLAKTPGVVLIDELDVHLHPKWQRGVVESLRRAFPAVQFIATSHSPFIVQSLQPEQVINLERPAVELELGKLSVDRIAQTLMGVERPDVSRRYEEMVAAAKDYLLTLEEAATAPAQKLAEFERRLAERVAPYADNPAFQAFLELKHTAKLGRPPNGAPSSEGSR